MFLISLFVPILQRYPSFERHFIFGLISQEPTACPVLTTSGTNRPTDFASS